MPKPADHEMGAYLQHVLREWLVAEPDRDEASFARMSNLSKSTVNNIKNKAAGAGSRTVKGFARMLGREVHQLYADADAWRRGQAPGAQVSPQRRFAEVPGWAESEARLRQTGRGRSYSDEAWSRAASTASERLPAKVDDFAVLQLVELWHQLLLDEAPPPASERLARGERPRSSPKAI